jgi:uncharacterized membrane protein
MRQVSMLDFVTLVAAIGCGVVAGVLFAFSTFVMKALGNLPPAQGIAAMQSINVAVINPWFMTAFLGTAAACGCAMIASLLSSSGPGAWYLLAGSVLYLAGSVLVTLLFNVPRNDALAAVSPASPEAARLWAAYLSTWTAWNHVRTTAALAAAVLFTLGFRFRTR